MQEGFKVLAVQELIDIVKRIVGYFHHSPLAYQQLKDTARKLSDDGEIAIGRCTSLVQECPTRWNSCHDMLARAVLLKSAITAVLNSNDMLPTPTQWRDIDNLSTLLHPVKLIIEKLCGDRYPTLSFVYPTIIRLLNRLTQVPGDSPVIKQFKGAVKRSIEIHFSGSDQRALMEMCAFLDPR